MGQGWEMDISGRNYERVNMWSQSNNMPITCQTAYQIFYKTRYFEGKYNINKVGKGVELIRFYKQTHD